ncbi:MAG: sulfite exporter TauE/SafE family protein [Desulfovermiculus sp.]|nr:sulfite exporter TauE/SafE family protein [Desulfovermiculus sp.]
MLYFASLWLAVLAISFVLTMVGLGGGLIFSPLFLMLGLSKAAAASTSLFLNLVAVSSAAVTYGRKRMVDFSLSVPLIVSSSLAAPLGSYVNGLVNVQFFSILMAVILILAAVRMAFVPKKDTMGREQSAKAKFIGGVIIGLAIGFLGGLLGIGGGVFVVPLLMYILHVPARTAAASSTFIVCFSSLTGFLGYMSMHSIDWSFVLPAALFSFAGGQAGARFMAARMQGRTISLIFSAILVVFSLRLLYQALSS